jgi:hypothetical protein
MKRQIAILLMVFSAGAIFAQQQQPAGDEIGAPDVNRVEGLPQEALKEISVDKFEQEGLWSAYISSDSGFATSRLFTGGPTAKQPIPDEQDLNISDNNVFGTRIDFLRRGHTSIYITAQRPIPIEGISKIVSVWVAGRNYNHRLYLVLLDSKNRYFELYMGRLNFQGWKKMAVTIPPQNGDHNGIVQTDYHFTTYMGIKVVGFRIDVDPMDAYGSYFIYLDDLRANTDLFAESNRDPDDPHDDW